MGLPSKVLIFIGLVAIVSSASGQSSGVEDATEKTILSGQRMEVYNDEGRANKSKNSRLLRLKLGLKVLAVAVLLPSAFGLVMMAAWKGITIALLAFLISVIVGINSLFSKYRAPLYNRIGSRSREDLAYTNVILARNPSLQEQWLRRIGGDFPIIGTAVDPFRVLPASALATI